MELTRGGTCDRCSDVLVRPDSGQPWCPTCEWNLDVYDPELLPPRGWRWIERLGHRRAYALDRELLAELTGTGVPRSHPGWSRARVALVVISLVLTLGALAAMGVGAFLVLAHRSPVDVFVGFWVFLLGFVCRPRLGRPPRRKDRRTRADAAALYVVLDAVAEAVGGRAPDFVVLDLGWNASIEQSGWRRRTTLRLGIGLWCVLDPPMRVALLAHELAHQVNGDPDRGLIVQPALATFARLARWTGAERTLGWVFRPDRRGASFVQLGFELVLWFVSRVFLVLHLALSAIGLREHHRAEYLADSIAADTAGSAAAAELLRRLVLFELVIRVVGYGAETDDPAAWSASVDSWVAANAASTALHAQASMRRADLWSSHPPAGARLRVVESGPPREGRIDLDGGGGLSRADLDRVDVWLGKWYAALHSRVLGTRTFRPAGRRATAAGER